MSVEEVITRCAAQILKLLEDAGEVNVLLLSERLGQRSIITYQALGWLAREGKVRYGDRGSQVYVSATRPWKPA